MASPRLETFCCPNRDPATEFVVTFQPVLFGALGLGSATLSLVFAVLQILPKRKGYRRLGQYPLPRPASSSRILFIISICDILGCTGIIVRSSVWLGLPNIFDRVSVANSTEAWPEVFCVGSAVWIQLFFSASFWWTFCYAVDVFLVVKTSAGISTIILYHMITWGLAVLLCVEGVAMLYYPSISDCEQGLQHAIPHYVTTYAPMLLVLVANPVFFNRTISADLNKENQHLLGYQLHIHLMEIMSCFFCWVPNIINESLLFYLEMQTDINDHSLRNIRNASLITWFIMGILNPMQAFLNTLAFHGWTGFDVDFRLQRSRELPWDSASTSVPNAAGHNTTVGATLLYQSHVQEAKKNMMSKGQHHSDAISVLSEGNWLTIHLSPRSQLKMNTVLTHL
uniref:G protein-coupled receptor 143 n=1 Tax=Sander lucioperca TaxID=283035 RepID=A0A8C9WTZ7_SANLU